MITASPHFTLPAADILSWLRGQTVLPYQPIISGQTHINQLQGLPNFQLIEGIGVPPHSDGIAGYRPLLVLANPSNNYIIRGTSQKDLSPQRPGSLLILDIDAEHEVHNIDPNGGHGPWSCLVWGDDGGSPLLKGAWSPERAGEAAAGAFGGLMDVLIGEHKL